jgi:hypothetical protein
MIIGFCVTSIMGMASGVYRPFIMGMQDWSF